VIAVSAFADTDGAPSGHGPSCYGHRDDSFAAFSNYGADVDIAAPGVCIRSTSLGSWYAELSGTSMAAPHATGAVSLYLAENPAATPSAVRDWLLGPASRPQNSAQGFLGDRDTIPEPVLYLGVT
jgi:subtilisin